MKSKSLLSFIAATSIAIPYSAAAVTINYDGTNPSLLNPDPFDPSLASLFTLSSTDDNVINISGGTISGFVFGGLANGSDSTNGNSITISSAIAARPTVIASGVYGGYVWRANGNATANNNSITVSGGKFGSDDWYYGQHSFSSGYTQIDDGEGTANSSNNHISINGGNTNMSLSVGHATHAGFGTAIANGNIFEASSGQVGDSVIGGNASGRNANTHASNNEIKFTGAATVGAVVIGGSAYGKTATTNSNRILLSGGSSIGTEVVGGSSYGGITATANFNTLEISEATIGGGYALGGYAMSSGISSVAIANSNVIDVSNLIFSYPGYISGGNAYSALGTAQASNNIVNTFNQDVTTYGSSWNYEDPWHAIAVNGGYAFGLHGLALENKISILGGNISGLVVGGYVQSQTEKGIGDASGNTVDISGRANLTYGLFGGYVRGNSERIESNRNSVKILSGEVSHVENPGHRLFVAGGYASGSSNGVYADGNRLEIAGGTLWEGDIAGGYANSQNGTGSAQANGNEVEVSGANNIFSDVFGGLAYSYLGEATVRQNSVRISGGTLHGSVFGGNAHAAHTSGSTVIDKNTVTISGGRIQGDVAGGYSLNGNSVTSNEVILEGGEIVGTVFGGYSHQTVITAVHDRQNVSGTQNASANSAISMIDGKAMAAGNQTLISGDTALVGGHIFGGNATVWAESGMALSGSSTGNSSANSAASALYSKATANSNYLRIKNQSELSNNLYGGYAVARTQAANAIAKNTTSSSLPLITTSATASSAALFSALSANSNSITIGDGTLIRGMLFGGYADLTAQAGNASAGNATVLAQSNVTIDSSANASANALLSTINADYNSISTEGITTVGIRGGYASLTAIGGNAVAGEVIATSYATSMSTALASAVVSNSRVSANNNSVILSEKANNSGGLYGGYASLSALAGDAVAGNATLTAIVSASAKADASVTASNVQVSANQNTLSAGETSTISGDIYGGYASLRVSGGNASGASINGSNDDSISVVDISGSAVSASDNHVRLNGSLNAGNIYGGYVEFHASSGSTSSGSNSNDVRLTGTSASTINNVVTIESNAKLIDPTVSIYGGYIDIVGDFLPDINDSHTGNTLNIYASGLVVETVENFQHYNFYVSDSHAQSDTMLTITSIDFLLAADVTGVIDFSGYAGNIERGDLFSILQINTISDSSKDLIWEIIGYSGDIIDGHALVAFWNGNVLNAGWEAIPEPSTYTAILALLAAGVSLHLKRRNRAR